ncbi:ABC transporter G family member 20 [Lepeophtheirus salmonis]|nr:ABC transporter G family member 20-like [Lepeophtheirus salmonis]
MKKDFDPLYSEKNPLALLKAKLAIWIRNAYKHFGTKSNTSLFTGLNMSVPKGVIYGLLGPSGCGKTTLLRVITGREKLNSGEFKIFGEDPGTVGLEVPGRRIGYMPQDLALYMELTILETLFFYGRLNKMQTSKIRSRAETLIEILELPHSGRLVQNMSGGQRRRISLAVALLHEPELLVLDEPTVGVDPVLRQYIWDHLLTIVNNSSKKRTIIITTHYVEEARQAHIVGMLRYGKILDEDAPTKLLEKFKALTLEEVFYELCQQEQRVICEGSEDEEESFLMSRNQRNSSLSSDSKFRRRDAFSISIEAPKKHFFPQMSSFFAIHRWKALVIKNFLRMFRKIGFLIFQLIFPAIQASAFCIAIGKDIKGMTVAVVNEEATYQECQNNYAGCILSFQSSKYVTMSKTSDLQDNLSCRLLYYIERGELDIKYYDDFETARNKVLNGDHWGVIHFEKGFSKKLAEEMHFIVSEPYAKDKEINTRMHIYLDMTNQQISLSIKQSLHSSADEFLKESLRACNKSEELGNSLLYFGNTIYGSNKPSYTEFMAPGIILSIAFFMAVGLTSQSFVTERREGLLERSFATGVTTLEVMLAHMVAQFIIMILQVTFVLLFMILVFKIPANGSIVLMISLVILQGLCGMSFGLLISSFCSTEHDAIQLALGSFYPLLLLSGIIWPLEGMSKNLRYFSYTLPQTLACKAMRGILSRGWNLEWSIVYLGFIVTIAWIFIFQILSLLLFRIRK